MSVPSYWREMPQRYRLQAAKCNKCGKVYFPPRLVCAQCGSREFDSIDLKDEGTVETFTVIRVAPSQFAMQVPYALGIVRMEDEVRLLTQITDCEPEEIEIGMPVKIEFRKISEDGEAGIIHYGYKCVPRG